MQQFRQILSNIEAIVAVPLQSRVYTPQSMFVPPPPSHHSVLADAAKNQHLAFMLSALQAGEIHNKTEELKAKYLALRRQQGDNTDPFDKNQKKKHTTAFQAQQFCTYQFCLTLTSSGDCEYETTTTTAATTSNTTNWFWVRPNGIRLWCQ